MRASGMIKKIEHSENCKRNSARNGLRLPSKCQESQRSKYETEYASKGGDCSQNLRISNCYNYMKPTWETGRSYLNAWKGSAKLQSRKDFIIWGTWHSMRKCLKCPTRDKLAWAVQEDVPSIDRQRHSHSPLPLNGGVAILYLLSLKQKQRVALLRLKRRYYDGQMMTFEGLCLWIPSTMVRRRANLELLSTHSQRG